MRRTDVGAKNTDIEMEKKEDLKSGEEKMKSYRLDEMEMRKMTGK